MQLVTQILTASPDLLPGYFSECSFSFLDLKTPGRWLGNIAMFCRFLNEKPPSVLFTGILASIEYRISSLIPSVTPRIMLSQGLQHKDFSVVEGTLNLLQSCFYRLDCITDEIDQFANHSDWRVDLQHLRDGIQKKVPDVQVHTHIHTHTYTHTHTHTHTYIYIYIYIYISIYTSIITLLSEYSFTLRIIIKYIASTASGPTIFINPFTINDVTNPSTMYLLTILL